MAAVTPFEQAKDLAGQLNGILSRIDIDALSREERELAMTIKGLLEHIRLGARDYDYADTRIDQQQRATETKQHLETLQATVLKASEYNLFGAVDVALASAHIQQLISNLQ